MDGKQGLKWGDGINQSKVIRIDTWLQLSIKRQHQVSPGNRFETVLPLMFFRNNVLASQKNQGRTIETYHWMHYLTAFWKLEEIEKLSL